MATAWGIDLGTTNSCISRLEDGVPKAISIEGSEIVPSVVLFSEGGSVVVGREAQNLELLHPERCIRSIKRRMGRGPAVSIDGRSLSPEQISAEILRALKQGAEKATGQTIDDVVITVPAYFDDAQRRATLRAGELAGLNVLRLLNEPTSASLVYDQVGSRGETSETSPEIVLVYDLGGGTFDVSVLEVFEGVREVRSTAGNSQLGGDDFDELLFRHFVDHLKHSRGVDVQGDQRARARLRNLAERTKIALSSVMSYRVSEEFIASDAAGAPVHIDLEITRREFEAMMQPLVDKTIELTRRAIDDAKLGSQDLSRICLVGGSTRVPLVRSLLAEEFGASQIHEEISADLAVALGASIQAGLLIGEPVARILVDVTAHSLGIRVIGKDDDSWEEPDTFGVVLPRNTVLPAEKTEEYYSVVEDQEKLVCEVFQGESRRVSENRSIGSFDVPLEPAPASSPIHVTFAYDLDGVVRVSVAQPGTSNRKTMRLTLPDATPSELDTPVLRKARALLKTLEESRRAALQVLITEYESAAIDDRGAAEEALLDFLMDVDSDS